MFRKRRASCFRNRRDLRDTLGMRPERPGRPAITGRTGDRVWDVLQLTSAVEPEAFTAWPHLFRGVQRRYPSQRAVPFIDARIDFDLRTAVSCSGKPKIQPRWLSVAYGSFVNKEGSNYQIQVGMLFPNDECPDIREPTGIDLIAQAWLACKPLIDLAR